MDGLDKYTAEAACMNCDFRGEVTPEVGKHVSTHACPVCQCRCLRPTSGEVWLRLINQLD